MAIWMIMKVRKPSNAHPRVIICTDMGGKDPKGFQSMIHYLMYANCFCTEALISSQPGAGRKTDILRMLDLYERDLPKLKSHSDGFPSACSLRKITLQGAIDHAPGKGWSTPSAGSDRIIQCARKRSKQPLWILVWGGLEDLAQALHDDPGIAPHLKVYWIAGPNKKWSANAYCYIAANFPDLWMIENNSSYRGWYLHAEDESKNVHKAFFDRHIEGRGSLGKAFGNFYRGEIKMGDTPSVAYLLNGNATLPDEPGWGGSFVPLKYSSRRIFNRMTTRADLVPCYGLIEWVLEGPDYAIEESKPCIFLQTRDQQFEGFYQGKGLYTIRFVPKEPGCWNYRIISPIEILDGLEGEFTCTHTWPGDHHYQDIAPLSGWWSDDPDPGYQIGIFQGAGSVQKWRNESLADWALRWSWLT